MTTFTEKVEEIIGSPDNSNRTRSGKEVSFDPEYLKQALLEAHQVEISRVLERVEKEVVGADEDESKTLEFHGKDFLAKDHGAGGRNQLRATQRQAINKIKGEYK